VAEKSVPHNNSTVLLLSTTPRCNPVSVQLLNITTTIQTIKSGFHGTDT
jgi:hypothetical protein